LCLDYSTNGAKDGQGEPKAETGQIRLNVITCGHKVDGITKQDRMGTNTEDKLKSFKEKIGAATVFDDGFIRLVGIELYDFIHADEALKTEFYRHLKYLEDPATVNAVGLVQEEIFSSIQEILKLTTTQEVQERQKEWNDKLTNYLRTERLGGDLTLPQCYLALQGKENFYRLGDNPYYAPFDGEISTHTFVIPIKKQYSLVEALIGLVIPRRKFANNPKALGRLDRLQEGYNQGLFKLDELIYRSPIQLHLPSFEKFHLACVRFHPRPGHVVSNKIFSSYGRSNFGEKQFREVKEAANVVIGDLIEVLGTQSEHPGVAQAPRKISGSASGIDATILKKLSVATAWGQIGMEFGQDETRVEIFVQNEVVQTYHFSDLGFQKKTATVVSLNTESWEMLRKMALMGGEFPYSDSDLKTKGDLSKKLRALFPHLNGEPIKCDSEKKVYRCNFQLKDKVGNRNNFIDQGRPGKRPYKPLLKSV
jgi:hypothetical protein